MGFTVPGEVAVPGVNNHETLTRRVEVLVNVRQRSLLSSALVRTTAFITVWLGMRLVQTSYCRAEASDLEHNMDKQRLILIGANTDLPALPKRDLSDDFQMTSISLLHFNDVYSVQPQKLSSKSSDTIDVTQFAQMVNDTRESWKKSSKDGLVLFSGDLFAPSVESSVTRGTHMVHNSASLLTFIHRQFPLP